MNKNQTQTQIIMALLALARQPIGTMRLMMEAYLDYNELHRYLNEMVSLELINKQGSDWLVTQKGRRLTDSL